MKDKIIDVCDDYNKCVNTCKPLTAEDRRRHIVAYKYDIELKNATLTQKQITRAENFNIGDIVTCLDTGFQAEILTKTAVKESGYSE